MKHFPAPVNKWKHTRIPLCSPAYDLQNLYTSNNIFAKNEINLKMHTREEN